ncbi:hypothetical protein [Paenirhodobacter sp.]|uniref:hypothetical protein n=1 Tax=Paenirhodobacter sp. TaxID=1965326 RepID=UPI003B3C5E22
MLKIALLVLTTMQDGSVRVTLSATDDMVECEANRDAVTTILTGAGRPPILALCGQSDLRLTPFVHGMPESAETNRYRVDLVGETFTVTPLAQDAPCREVREGARRSYCARSGQSVVQ